MRLHALVPDVEAARAAVAGGATVIQLRVKGAESDQLRELGSPIAALCREAGVTFVVNDDVGAALELGADGVHLGRGDPGAERALRSGLLLGLSAASAEQALAAQERGAGYVGAGPIWATPTKPDADPPLGLSGLAEICAAVTVPVVAIGGIDEANAGACLAAGAAGVAVVRAASRTAELRRVLDRAAV
jgi:thiamine-phosphate pyrophosphorylase